MWTLAPLAFFCLMGFLIRFGLKRGNPGPPASVQLAPVIGLLLCAVFAWADYSSTAFNAALPLSTSWDSVSQP